jgi:hypothetical protein
MTLGLTDAQLRALTAACQPLPPEKRAVFLERLVAHLDIAGQTRHPTDRDLEIAARAALHGLMQGDSAPAA